MVYNLVAIFFGPYLTSLNLTSSSVSVGCFIAIAGAKRLGWLAGLAVVQILGHHDGASIHLIRGMASTCILCLRLISLKLFLSPFAVLSCVLKFSVSRFAWGRNTCMLWSIAAIVTLATNTKYLLNKNSKKQKSNMFLEFL